MTSFGSRLSFVTLLVGLIAIVQLGIPQPARAQVCGYDQAGNYLGCGFDSAKKVFKHHARKHSTSKTAKTPKHQKQPVTKQGT